MYWIGSKLERETIYEKVFVGPEVYDRHCEIRVTIIKTTVTDGEEAIEEYRAVYDRAELPNGKHMTYATQCRQENEIIAKSKALEIIDELEKDDNQQFRKANIMALETYKRNYEKLVKARIALMEQRKALGWK